ncbi:hypothetical protein [Massilia sp. BJB1822]|uniref:hypothetical protein n=1 Tax=Massilia sp. BJB1822 TaxID=2744470 RepID=UPI001594D7B5|nr:hypothetical protein [Massilia sp. BJB1822]NVE00230.1 hypothetical protein [Massilia sp. BJB1822]
MQHFIIDKFGWTGCDFISKDDIVKIYIPHWLTGASLRRNRHLLAQEDFFRRQTHDTVHFGKWNDECFYTLAGVKLDLKLLNGEATGICKETLQGKFTRLAAIRTWLPKRHVSGSRKQGPALLHPQLSNIRIDRTVDFDRALAEWRYIALGTLQGMNSVKVQRHVLQNAHASLPFKLRFSLPRQQRAL